MSLIRNFCIIAHIDHGKSTLADRLLDITGTISDRDKQDQLLDDMDLERERGITIKSHAIQMNYDYEGQTYVLNLIDTPGHVDFSYEVSRSIAACEGALLIVDAAQSIQAQTISNLYLALENDLEIIPILNKIDLPSAKPDEVSDDVVDLLGCKLEEIIRVSAKTGEGVSSILQEIVNRVPAPKKSSNEELKALIFDSVYNPFRGIEIYFRVFSGKIKKGQEIKFLATNKKYFADEVGTLSLKQIPKNEIGCGDVGYLITGIKNAKEVKVGDTIVDSKANEILAKNSGPIADQLGAALLKGPSAMHMKSADVEETRQENAYKQARSGADSWSGAFIRRMNSFVRVAKTSSVLSFTKLQSAFFKSRCHSPCGKLGSSEDLAFIISS